ncbi:MAG: hypothetical protein WC474_05325 [Hydrogenophilaceae bacterium]
MRTIILGISVLMATLFGTAVFAAEDGTIKVNNGESVESVRKTCDCVRQHPSGYPYIEPRITTCKTYKNAEGHVKSYDCLNCYALCTDKPAS